jgi:hypothetical protein
VWEGEAELRWATGMRETGDGRRRLGAGCSCWLLADAGCGEMSRPRVPRLPSPVSRLPFPLSLIPQVELDGWHFCLITTVLPIRRRTAWFGSVVRTHVELVFPQGANTVSKK